MYEAVHAHPEGESTVSRLAATAADYGYEGIVVRNYGGLSATVDAGRIRDAYGVDVVSGVEVRAEDPAQASGYLGSLREEATVLALRGGSIALNRFAARQERVDVLAHPMDGGDVNHVLVKEAKAHGVRLEVNLGRVLRTSGGRRVRALSGLRKLRELIGAHDAPFVVSADAASHLQLRAPRELVALGEVIGFEPADVEAGLALWARIAAANRERLCEGFVVPCVRRRRHGEPPADGDE
jgi:ribonuclease P/MRP protein subunit RPP1